MAVWICGMVLGPASPPLLLADFQKTSWQYFKPISLPQSTSGKYLRFSLDGEVYAQSRRSLADLRVVNSDLREVPYASIEERETSTRVKYAPRLFNQAVLPGSYTTVSLDLANDTYHNQMVLKTRSRNFKRRVEVFGSQDGKRWLLLRDDAYIFDFSGEQQVHLTSISYPESRYPYLQVRVWNDSEPPLEIDGVEVFLHQVISPGRVSRRSESLERSEDPELKATVCVLDLKYDHIPSDFLVIETSQENFSRRIEIQGSSNRERWDSHLHSEFYRFRTSKYDVEKRTFHFPEVRHRYLKVIVYNNDDPPLQLEGFEVKGVEKDLFFEAQQGMKYFLYYGNPRAKSLIHDLAQVKNYLNLSTLTRVELGGQRRNQHFVSDVTDQPWTERYPLVLWGVLLVAVIGLGGYILKLMARVSGA